jgi:hypothetical protein
MPAAARRPITRQALRRLYGQPECDEEIFRRYQTGDTYASIAAAYGVSYERVQLTVWAFRCEAALASGSPPPLGDRLQEPQTRVWTSPTGTTYGVWLESPAPDQLMRPSCDALLTFVDREKPWSSFVRRVPEGTVLRLLPESELVKLLGTALE